LCWIRSGARIVDARSETFDHAEVRFDLAQRQQTAVRREGAAVEAGNDRFAGDR
jgi:hypothetical protein